MRGRNGNEWKQANKNRIEENFFQANKQPEANIKHQKNMKSWIEVGWNKIKGVLLVLFMFSCRGKIKRNNYGFISVKIREKIQFHTFYEWHAYKIEWNQAMYGFWLIWAYSSPEIILWIKPNYEYFQYRSQICTVTKGVQKLSKMPSTKSLRINTSHFELKSKAIN